MSNEPLSMLRTALSFGWTPWMDILPALWIASRLCWAAL